MNQFDSFYRYVYQDNSVENCYININDGNDYSVVSSLNIYSDTDSVVKLMLESYQYYISDSININDEGSYVENEKVRHYLELESFSSKTLSDCLRTNTFDNDDAVKILKQIAVAKTQY